MENKKIITWIVIAIVAFVFMLEYEANKKTNRIIDEKDKAIATVIELRGILYDIQEEAKNALSREDDYEAIAFMSVALEEIDSMCSHAEYVGENYY